MARRRKTSPKKSAADADLASLPAHLVEELQPLRKLLHESPGAVVPLVGSGLSASLGSWRALLEELIGHASEDARPELMEQLDKERYLEVASYLESDCPGVGRSRICSVIKQRFQRPEAPRPETYAQLAALPVKHFATTNYDPWLKDAVDLRFEHSVRVLLPSNPGDLADLGPETSPFVLMLHGDADKPESCVLSAEGYRALQHGNAAFNDAMKGLVAQRRLLFIGHSVADPDLAMFLDAWQQHFAPAGGAPRHFFLGAATTSMQRRRLERKGVQPIDYSPAGDHGVLETVLRHLAEPQEAPRAPRRPRPGAAGPLPEDYLRFVENRCGSVVLTGLLTDKSLPSIPLESVYVPVLVSRSDLFPERELAGQESPVEALVQALGSGSGEEKETVTDRQVEAALRAIGVSATDARKKATQDSTLRRLRELEGTPTSEQVTRILRTLELDDALARIPHLLVEGDPGSGKTTSLKHVAMALTQAHRGETSTAGRMGFRAPFPAPLFVPLRHFWGHLRRLHEDGELDGAGPPALVAYLEAAIQQRGGAAWLEPALESGDAVLLLDALDEIPDPHLRRRAVAIISDFIATYPDCRYLLSTRPAGLDAPTQERLKSSGFAHAQVQPLDLARAARFVTSWYRAMLTDQQDADRRAQALIQRLQRAGSGILEFIETPILLVAVAVVHQTKGDIPERRAEAFEECTRALAHRWDYARDEVGPALAGSIPIDDKISLFEELAADLHRRDAQTIESPELVTLTRTHLPAAAELGDIACSELIEHLAHRSGLIIPEGETAYRFRHLAFQEFLTARWLGDRAEDPVGVLAARLADQSWREVALLAPAYKAIASKVPARKFLRDLATAFLVEPPSRPTADHAEGLGALARAYTDLRSYTIPDLETAVEQLVTPWVAVLEDRAQPSSKWSRIAIGTALGYLGDPRLSEDRRWVHIPAGRFWRGGNEYPWEGPAGWVETPEYWIQRWPVTVGEYARFIEAGGYAQPRWWSDAGWSQREEESWERPDDWYDQASAPPNHPVIGVSWYEAAAYCAWLNEALDLPPGGISLPSESCWEKAARGGELLPGDETNPSPQREYPWGEWKDGHAHVEDREAGPAPVGCFPAGHGPYDLWDQAGNVWEWCEDTHHGSYEGAPDDGSAWVDEAFVGRVIRGGAFNESAWFARSASRSGPPPSWRSDILGFRPAMSVTP